MTTPVITIKKGDGTTVPYDQDKVFSSILKSGADKKTAHSIIEKIQSQLRPGIRTADIYRLVRNELKDLDRASAYRYNLRSALLRLGPAGFNFEKYVAAILTAYGYKTSLPDELTGACVTHEVDVIAEKDGRRMFIEAKFRNNFDDVVDIKDTMSTWARFLDLVDGSKLGLCPHFDEAWIVTNARFTSHSLKFGHCKNMVMVGWNHPRERTFAKMVDLSNLYPLTLLEDVSDAEFALFAKENLILCRDIVNADSVMLSKKLNIDQKRIKSIQSECKEVIRS